MNQHASSSHSSDSDISQMMHSDNSDLSNNSGISQVSEPADLKDMPDIPDISDSTHTTVETNQLLKHKISNKSNHSTSSNKSAKFDADKLDADMPDKSDKSGKSGKSAKSGKAENVEETQEEEDNQKRKPVLNEEKQMVVLHKLEPPMSEAILAPEQKRAIEMVMSGRNTFVTGAAGTGKSHLIRNLVKRLQEANKQVRLTASTGMAAVNISGVTIHSFSCVYNSDAKMSEIQQRGRSPSARKAWLNVDVIIIDECSMLEPGFFHRVNEIAKVARRSQAPFGGVQVVVVGDFFQLPPVVSRDKYRFGSKGGQDTQDFIFETEAWTEADFAIIELTEVHRQDDKKFIEMLHRIRKQEHTPTDMTALLACRHTHFPNDGILPTMLCTNKKQAADKNNQCMGKLPGEYRVYQMISGVMNPQTTSNINETRRSASKKKLFSEVELTKARERLLDNSVVEEQIYLKVGAQVMLCANLHVDMGLCNGSRGVVVGFKQAKGSQIAYPVVRFVQHDQPVLIRPYQWKSILSEQYAVWIGQIPLKIAYAITIHKSQGQTMDRVSINLASSFASGQAYVALSRARNLASIRLEEFHPTSITCHPKVKAYYATFEKKRTSATLSNATIFAMLQARNTSRSSVPSALLRPSGSSGLSGLSSNPVDTSSQLESKIPTKNNQVKRRLHRVAELEEPEEFAEPVEPVEPEESEETAEPEEIDDHESGEVKYLSEDDQDDQGDHDDHESSTKVSSRSTSEDPIEIVDDENERFQYTKSKSKP